MNEERIINRIRILYRKEELRIQQELDEESLAGLKSKALDEFRQSRAGKPGGARRILFTTMKWAAAIILIISIPAAIYFIYQDRIPDYSSMLEEIRGQQMDEETSLILSDGSEITIESDKSVVAYDESGKKVEINSEKTVSLEREEGATEKEIPYNRLIVPYGKKSTITLSDGSVVWLNSGSYLVYPQEFTRKKREVYLAGEAYFEVNREQSRPFIVMTEDVKIEVLGTTFNVNSYPENKEVETVLVEGSVEVSRSDSRNSNKNSQILDPGQLASYSREFEEISTQDVDVEFYVSWKDGYFLCEKITLDKLVQKLSRHYNIEIIVEDAELKNNTFSGKLDNRETIYEVLKIIDASKSINYIEDGSRILIRQSK